MVAAACLMAALGAQGGRFSARLDVLTHFAPLWLFGALLATGYALVFASPPLRWVLVGAGVAGALAAAALILPELIRPISPAVNAGALRQIKLIQFNAWDENVQAGATADWIVAQKPDLVMMQEVEDPMRQAMIQRGFHYVRGMLRTAIFSRAEPTYSPFQVPMRDWPILPSFARATFHGADGPFSVVAVHLEWPTQRGQQRQMATLAEVLDRYPTDRLIVTGDFNLTPWSFALRRLDERLGMERRDRAIFSWPARLPPKAPLPWSLAVLPIDHVYAGRAWRTVSIERGPRLGSDHYPLVVKLALVD
jgi:endonuclease/exonuclease/phosphatase (EEP) superfamily protein YafD